MHLLSEQQQPCFIFLAAATTNAPTTKPEKRCTFAFITLPKNIFSLSFFIPNLLRLGEFAHENQHQQERCGCHNSIEFLKKVNHTCIYELYGFWFTIKHAQAARRSYTSLPATLPATLLELISKFRGPRTAVLRWVGREVGPWFYLDSEITSHLLRSKWRMPEVLLGTNVQVASRKDTLSS